MDVRESHLSKYNNISGNEIDFKNPFNYKVEDGIVASKYDHNQLVKALKKIVTWYY